MMPRNLKLLPGRHFFLGLAALSILAFNSPKGSTFSYLQPGMQIPEFQLRTFDGSPVSPADVEGSGALVVVFWASWSPRSLQELRDLERLRGELSEFSFRVFAVNVEAQTLSSSRRDSLRRLAQALETKHTYLWDDGLTVFRRFGVIAVPSSLVIDATGTIQTCINGYSPKSRATLEDSLKALLGLVSPGMAQTAVKIKRPAKKSQLHYNLGRRLLQMKQYRRAAEQFLKAIELDSTFVQPFLSYGEVQLKSGDIAGAKEAYRRALALDPHNAAALWRMGRLAAAQGDTDTAFDYLNRALREDENLYPVRLDLARIEMEKGNLEAARLEISRAETSNPSSPRLQIVKAELAWRMGEREEAVSLLRRTVETLLREAY